jgi:UDP:flavonoid glycosyltransferase YjiC (YdhE family)
MPRLDEAYEDLLDAAADADAIVSHPLTFTAPLVGEVLKRPWAGAVLAPLSFFSRMDPPQVVAHPAVAALHRVWPNESRWTIPLGKLITRSWGNPLQDLRRRLGLPRGGHPLYEGQFSPFLNLAMFSKVLAAPQPDWPPKTVVTGAVSYDAVHGGMPADLDRFLDSGPPPVVFTLGSSAVSVANAPAFYETSAAAARSLGVRAVLLVGKSGNNAPRVTSEGTFVAEWAPHSELFRRAAAVVHQGGAGTLHSGLAAGHPTIIVPFAHDQPDYASRLERWASRPRSIRSNTGRSASARRSKPCSAMRMFGSAHDPSARSCEASEATIPLRQRSRPCAEVQRGDVDPVTSQPRSLRML